MIHLSIFTLFGLFVLVVGKVGMQTLGNKRELPNHRWGPWRMLCLRGWRRGTSRGWWLYLSERLFREILTHTKEGRGQTRWLLRALPILNVCNSKIYIQTILTDGPGLLFSIQGIKYNGGFFLPSLSEGYRFYVRSHTVKIGHFHFVSSGKSWDLIWNMKVNCN